MERGGVVGIPQVFFMQEVDKLAFWSAYASSNPNIE